MNKNKSNQSTSTLRVLAINVLAGDVLTGSGFTVTRNAYAGQPGKAFVEGFYPGSTDRLHIWNRATHVTVARGE